MIKFNGDYLEIQSEQISNKLVYTDRNGVYNGLSLDENTISNIKAVLNGLNRIVRGGLKVISNESEFSLGQVFEEDKNRGLNLSLENYRLSTLSSVRFLLEVLGLKKCYFIGNDNIALDLKKMGVQDVINLLEVEEFDPNIPVIFAKPDFAAKASFSSDKEIEENIMKDIQFLKLVEMIKRGKPKIIFCHSKPNCDRVRGGNKFRELHLGFYFKYLIDNYGYKVGEDIFDLGKGDYSDGSFFDISLGKKQGGYSDVVGIGDVYTDIEYVLQNGGTGILVNSGDGINNEEVISRLGEYKGRFFNIIDASYLRLI